MNLLWPITDKHSLSSLQKIFLISFKSICLEPIGILTYDRVVEDIKIEVATSKFNHLLNRAFPMEWRLAHGNGTINAGSQVYPNCKLQRCVPLPGVVRLQSFMMLQVHFEGSMILSTWHIYSGLLPPKSHPSEGQRTLTEALSLMGMQPSPDQLNIPLRVGTQPPKHH